MKYTALTSNDVEALRRERIATLEGEHFRLALQLREVLDSPDIVAAILARQADLERRIALHQGESAKQDTRPEGAAEHP